MSTSTTCAWRPTRPASTRSDRFAGTGCRVADDRALVRRVAGDAGADAPRRRSDPPHRQRHRLARASQDAEARLPAGCARRPGRCRDAVRPHPASDAREHVMGCRALRAVRAAVAARRRARFRRRDRERVELRLRRAAFDASRMAARRRPRGCRCCGARPSPIRSPTRAATRSASRSGWVRMCARRSGRVTASTSRSARRPGPIAPLVRIDHPAVLVESVKLAEDRSGDVIVRLYESEGARALAEVSFDFDVESVVVTDLLEREIDPPAGFARDGRSVRFTLRPFQLVTLRSAAPLRSLSRSAATRRNGPDWCVERRRSERATRPSLSDRGGSRFLPTPGR